MVVQPTFTDTDQPETLAAWLLVPSVRDLPLRNRPLGETIADDLETLTVSNSLSQGYQTFSFTLAPRRVVGALGWEDVLLAYTYIEIWAQRIPGDEVEQPLLLGLIDTTETSWDFSGPQPRRIVTVQGRSLAATLVDHRWWCNHYLRDADATKDIVPEDLRNFFEVPPEEELVVNLQTAAGLKSLGILALDPHLLEGERRPPAILERIFRWFVVSGITDGDSRPLVKLRFAHDVPLSSKLVLRASAGDFFDPGAWLTAQVLQTSIPTGSAWEMLSTYAEPPFTELFSDTVIDAGPRGKPAVQVTARKPPFLGHIAYPNKQAMVRFSARGPAQGWSLFDAIYGHWRRYDETEWIDASDIVSAPSLRRGLDQSVYSLYFVTPATFSAPGVSGTDKLWEQIIPPLIDLGRRSPSLITRFGVRPLNLTTKYIATVGPDGQQAAPFGDLRRTCLVYEALLRSWFFMRPLQWRGSYVLKGRASLRVGKRVFDSVRQREYYVTAVVHQFDFRQRPSWRTTVQVDRGWDLVLPNPITSEVRP